MQKTILMIVAVALVGGCASTSVSPEQKAIVEKTIQEARAGYHGWQRDDAREDAWSLKNSYGIVIPVTSMLYFYDDRGILTDEGLKELASRKEIQFVCIMFDNSQKITDKGLGELFRMKQLRFVGLPTHITDAGLKELGKMKQLEGLDFHACEKITDEGLKHLAKLNNLITIDLVRTGVTKAGVAELQKRFPKCEIGHDFQ
jgi:uncharacterized protein YcfL